MKINWKWTIGIIVGLVILFFLPYILFNVFGYGPGMMGSYGFRHPTIGDRYEGFSMPMMGRYGFSPFGSLFMGFGMLLGWLVPLGLLFLIVYGAVALFNRNRPPTATATPSRSCSNCGKTAASDWNTCPDCGTTL